MLMEYRIANKVNGLIGHKHGERMNTILIHSDNSHVMHITKEYDSSTGWHKRVVSIEISDSENPSETVKASFQSKQKLKMLISILQSHLEELE